MKISTITLLLSFVGSSYSCFTNNADLKNGIEDYLDAGCTDEVQTDECANSQVVQTYGYPMNSWCFTKDITDMRFLFAYYSDFNEDISLWDVSAVKDFSSMFEGATSFNGNISAWNTSSATDMPEMFDGATSFNQDLSNWDVSSVTSMYSMFNDAASFNQDLSNWDVSSLTTMRTMFWDAASFNQDLSIWNTSSVTEMSYMFSGATSFNQNLCEWNEMLKSYANVDSMFWGSGCQYEQDPDLDEGGPFCAESCGANVDEEESASAPRLSFLVATPLALAIVLLTQMIF